MIFISYRREDAQAEARLIWVDLNGKFDGEVFFDRESIKAGQKWPDRIRSALERASTVVVVIGKTWLNCKTPEGRRRLEIEGDWVREEIKYALVHDKKIVPVLLDGTPMPSKGDLPEILNDLADWQAIPLTQGNWTNDVLRILDVAEIPSLPVPKIVLASQSPRRIELLQQIGWERDVDYYAVSAAELIRYNEGDDIQEFVAAIAHDKIRWVMKNWSNLRDTQEQILNLQHGETIIVGVDTLVVCEGEILNTPLEGPLRFAGDVQKEEARQRSREMLKHQNGKPIEIITSIAVVLASDARDHHLPLVCETVTIVTNAQLRKNSYEDIESYVSTDEPLDKAGAFGIQGQGVVLFERISGSYSNIVGLPLREFIGLLRDNFGELFAVPPLKSLLGENTVGFQEQEFSALCVGDINYDFVYDKLPSTFFANLRPPGEKILGEIRRGVGGTAVNFAKGLQKAGFSSCSVVGVIGADVLGQEIESELSRLNITSLLERNPHQSTSIAIILRNKVEEDTSITLTDANQALDNEVVDRTREKIRQSDVFYCSGYSLTDEKRRTPTKQMLQHAINAGCIAILDVVVGMDRAISYQMLKDDVIGGNSRKKYALVIVSEFPEIFRWLNIAFDGESEIQIWEENKRDIATTLLESFSVAILRTSDYTHEVIIDTHSVSDLIQLDYPQLPAEKKVGYGDLRTADQIYSFLSPRILIASKSPQRLYLMRQIVDAEKLEVRVSKLNEEKNPTEHPHIRVKRLAEDKAKAVLEQGEFSDSIEFIIGADTEIYLEDTTDPNGWRMIDHPKTIEDAEKGLRYLSGKSHVAVTGIAVIGIDPRTGQLKTEVELVKTHVVFDRLNDHEIETYAASREPLDRAGGYAIQGLGMQLIDGIEGSYSNVVGLPLECLAEIMSKRFDRPIWGFNKVSDWKFPKPIKDAQS